jgi:transposase InsO family protein
MSAHQARFPIATMARVLGVSEAGHYAWRQRPPSAHAVADAALLKRVRTIHASSRETYGVPRVHAELRAGGEKHGRKRIARLMRAAGLVGASRRRNGVTSTRRDPDARPAPDLVDRDFTAAAPNQLWVADITFVPTANGFLYLAVVLDAWSRKIVGWAMATHLRAELVVDALEMAVAQRRPGDVIHHSDQGSQGGFKRSSQHHVRELLRHARMRVAGSSPVRIPGRGAHGLLQLHRRLLQPGKAAFRPRLSIAHGLRSCSRERHRRTVITQAYQHSTKAGQL